MRRTGQIDSLGFEVVYSTAPPPPLPFSPWANLPLFPALSLAPTWPTCCRLQLTTSNAPNTGKTIKIKQDQRLHIRPLQLICKQNFHARTIFYVFSGCAHLCREKREEAVCCLSCWVVVAALSMFIFNTFEAHAISKNDKLHLRGWPWSLE